ncbi:hypothetical protein BFJ65_g14997 [Fusarium oxysporum f. sp. cepae]|uniref:ABC transporter domain-containing protein n=1 Tax=Fusarium oxysporum f. sp. cepae TaxID=396571 RepID=A0A3L6N2H2_FUSOX|nr:hypothetical protein BFJ65_g14997 [Fusarium oxysporum f. sp. cepae]
MGASGAGKTTVLDVLAARKNIGVILGDILIDAMKLRRPSSDLLHMPNSFTSLTRPTPEFGLTVEQRKRVSIGVELAAMPEPMLFLDETTFGIGSQSAFNVVRFLKMLAASG